MTAPFTRRRDAMVIAARHAPVAAQGVCYGQMDLAAAVSDEDAADVVLAGLARAHPDVQVARVWSSPLIRCTGPAARIAQALGLPHHVDARLSELSFGEWEGRRYEDLSREAPEALARFFDGWADGAAAPGGEGVTEIGSRVQAWAAELRPDVHLLVSHAGVVRALRVLVGRRSWREAMDQPVEPLALEAFRVPGVTRP